jgi:hypothetical protein
VTEVGNPAKQFTTLARSIAARRDSGFLVYSIEGDSLSFLFYQGKLVDGQRGGASVVDELQVRMQTAGVLSTVEVFREYSTIAASLGSDGARIVRFFLEHLLLDLIFQLQKYVDGECRFDPRVVSFDRDVAPSISIGRILLDIVALQEDPHLFRSNLPVGSVVRMVAAADPDSPLQGAIERGLRGSDCTIEELKEHSGISQYDYQEVLLEMLESGQLEVLSFVDEAEVYVGEPTDNALPIEGSLPENASQGDLSQNSIPTMLERVNQQLRGSAVLPIVIHQMFITLLMAGILRAMFEGW